MWTDLPLISAEQAMYAARTALPGLKPTSLILPSRLTTHYVIFGTAGSAPSRRDASFVCVDAYSGRTLEIYDARRSDPRIYTVEAVEPLNFGDFGSIPLKLLYVAFWLTIIGLPLTGILFLYSNQS